MTGIDDNALKRIEAQMRAKAARAADVRPALVKVNKDLAADGRRLFDSRGASGAHGRWPERARPKPHPLMRDTGRLFDSLAKPRGAGRVFDARPDGFAYGTSVPYAKKHQQGLGVPRRRVIDPTQDQQQRNARTIARYIETGEVE